MYWSPKTWSSLSGDPEIASPCKSFGTILSFPSLLFFRIFFRVCIFVLILCNPRSMRVLIPHWFFTDCVGIADFLDFVPAGDFSSLGWQNSRNLGRFLEQTSYERQSGNRPRFPPFYYSNDELFGALVLWRFGYRFLYGKEESKPSSCGPCCGWGTIQDIVSNR